MKYMGLDYGKKRIGVALSDDNGRLAMPHAIFPNEKDAVAALASLAQERGVEEAVVGESVDGSGAPNPVMEDIRAFAQAFGEATGIPVRFEKEWFTTLHARGEGGGSVDDAAAALILQRYLDKINQTNDNDR